MTDTCKVRNVFYDCNLYNSTNKQIPAQTDDNLLYPLIDNSNDYSVAIAKAKIDLSTIPLTNKNIPLKKYSVGVKVGTNEAFAYVKQLNGNLNNYVYNATTDGIINKYQYNSTGTLTQVSSIDVSTFVAHITQLLVDDYENFYVMGYNGNNSNNQSLFILDKTPTLINTVTVARLKCIAIDRANNIYVASDGDTNSQVQVYSNVNGESSVVLTPTTTITTNKAGALLQDIHTIAVDNTLLVGYNINTITLYNAQYQAITDIIETNVTQLGIASSIMNTQDRFTYTDNGVLNDTIIGLPTSGSGSATNVMTGSSFVTGVWYSSPVISSDMSYGFGTGTDNYTYFFTYSGGQTGTPSIAATTPLIGYMAANNQNSYFGTRSSSTNNLFAFDVNCLNNVWSRVCSDFKASPTVSFNAFDVNPSTGIVYAVGSDNNIYASNLAIQPRQMIISPTLGSNNVQRIDVGYPTGSNIQTQTFQTSSVYTKPVSSASYYNVGMYRAVSNTGQLSMVIGQSGYNESEFDQLVICDMSFNVLNTFSLPVFIGSMCRLHRNNLTNYCVIADGTTIFYLYSEVDGTLFKTITLPDPLVAYEYLAMSSIESSEAGGNTFLAVANGYKLYIYSFDASMNETLVLNTSYQPNGSNENITSLSWCSDPAILFACVSQNGASTPSQIVSIPFTDNTYSQINYSATVVYDTNATNLVPSYNCLQHQENLGELYALKGTSSGDSGYIQVYNYLNTPASGANVGTIQVNVPYVYPFGVHYYPPVYYMMPSATGLYTYSQITSNKQAVGIASSRTSSKRLYITDSVGNVWFGTVNNSSINFSQLQGVNGTYTTISTSISQTPIYNTKLFNNTISNQQLLETITIGNEYVSSIARNDIDQTFTVAQQNANLTNYAVSNMSQNWQTTSATANAIFTKNGEDIDAGYANIYNIQVFIDAINSAFALATQRLNSMSSGALAEPPVLSLDYQTGLCTLSNLGTLSQTGNGVLMNAPLHAMINFYSTVDQASGYYQIVLSPNASSVTQTSKSIFQFNQLDKILFQSNTIYVTGAFFSTNESNRIITDVDIPIADFVENIGQELYYQPNFLRPYVLNSNLPLSRIQLNILYQYRDGSQYQLYINPSQNYSTKLQWIKKF